MRFTRTILAILAVCVLMLAASGCTRIGPGHVGIRVENAGNDKGVLEKGAQTGWQFYTPGFTQIIEYPTYFMPFTYTAAVGEGHPVNEELQFVTKDGQQGTADVGFTLGVMKDRAPHFYVKYKLSADEIPQYIHGPFRNILRQQLADEALKYTTDELYFGAKRAELELRVKEAVNKIINVDGTIVDQLAIINNLRFPKGYVESISAKIQALQDAQKVEAQKQIAIAEAARITAEAKGRADAKIEDARGDAESQRIRTASITPQILEMKRLNIQEVLANKWDGAMPQWMMGSSGAGPTSLLVTPPQHK